ncbi:MAG: hypothetical protein FJ280_13975 [Planctomycetes bacterium]|nr:hypothetical protein [Planctomycetota bacterium]
MARRTHAFQRQDSAPRGRPGVFTLIKLLAFVAIGASPISTAAGAMESSGGPSPLEETLAAIRVSMAHSPAPWPQAWQEEYVHTICQAVTGHQDASAYAVRLQILRDGFGPYWDGLRKSGHRSLFEVHQAEIRWYVESLMSTELPGNEERQKLREQYRNLLDHTAGALITQFPFLDPNRVQAAKSDHLAQCWRGIETPLVPVFLHSLTEDQMNQLKERWHNLRYARVDLWWQLGGGAPARAKKTQVSSGAAHPDYLLAQRSLDQLRGQVWSLIPGPPEYYQDAAGNQRAALKQRAQSQAEARAQERRLGVAVWQTEYLSLLLGALLETAQEQQP